jgi:hypothetical protein
MLRLGGRCGAISDLSARPWLSDAQNASVELTPRSDSGPEHRWTGYRLPRDQDYVVPRAFVVAQRNQGAHVLLLLARSQSEQVDSAASCRAKIQRIAAAVGAPGLIEEVDRTTPGRIGTYVVRLENSQTGAEVVIGRERRLDMLANAGSSNGTSDTGRDQLLL